MNRIFDWLSTNDTKMFLVVNQQWRCKPLDLLLPKITHLGGATFTLSVLLTLMLIFSNDVRYWAIDALISLSLSFIAVQIIKKIFGRKRPYLNLPNVITVANPLKDFSFPSGHTAAAFSIAIVFSLHSPILAFTVIPLAMIVALSRMYVGLHYPTDCLIGAFLGAISSILAVFFILV
ncbi:phosphatase PAP2 family protein [Alkalihalobacillus sp. MEB130]|uniref:phosphatase PAP2 family protein n=1 Tax=Alkalihalobacillus sp. MEB130 TaxID=2976704 RepID=UPI0028DEA81E|nr:phosphatase PAP2 family protein [Alkalihalobacillus sp. MEB130]MDT8859310.1 phosphatase PAP2 family protein [Alkalihalobacillus sp. MEB130]